MEHITILEDFKSILRDENQCIEEFILKEQEIKDAVMDKDWPKLERALGDLESQSSFLSLLDDRRQGIWNDILEKGQWTNHRSFYEVMSYYPRPWRQELGELYRKVKMNTLRLKGLTEGIDNYVQTTAQVIREALNQVEGKGKTYNKTGSFNPEPHRPLVLDKSL